MSSSLSRERPSQHKLKNYFVRVETAGGCLTPIYYQTINYNEINNLSFCSLSLSVEERIRESSLPTHQKSIVIIATERRLPAVSTQLTNVFRNVII